MYATVYPNKVFDYMAAGRPVILAIDGVIRQVVEQAEAGVFVSPGDASALAARFENWRRSQTWDVLWDYTAGSMWKRILIGPTWRGNWRI